MTALNTSSTTDQTELVYIINSLHIGGAEIGLCRLLNGLDPARYDITVVSLDGFSQDFVDEFPAWVRIVDLRIRSGIGVSTIRELYSIVRTADVIVGSLIHSSMVARAAKIVNPTATIATWHHADQFKTDLRRRAFRRTAGLCDVVLADSEPVAEMLISDLRLDRCLVHTVPIAGIDLEEYTPVTHQDSTNITVGSVGRLSEQKNHETVLDVAEQFQGSNIQFKIAGNGDLYEELQAQIRGRGLTNVSLLGLVEDIPAFLADLDIYFQPSLWEGLCITVLEAMAAGLPVVGSDVGGIGRNVEEGKSGYLYDPHDTDGFVSGIQKLRTDPNLRRQLGNRGREIVGESFTQKLLVKEFERAISLNIC
ncbi:glycosyltransferase family 4 protein [Halorubrum salsamenti]|uniref:glycosyltransferase family 4 protein n=1 Tax=Halorubrum salsamenti TaxID=2583990 RepID=UPI0011A73EBB|nr:glycosyltransferase family 4 protein [Halorubrum salsamenti]